MPVPTTQQLLLVAELEEHARTARETTSHAKTERRSFTGSFYSHGLPRSAHLPSRHRVGGFSTLEGRATLSAEAKRMNGFLASRLEEVATAWPDRVALREPGRDVTFGALWAESRRRVEELSREGARDGAVVVLSNANGVDWLAVFFGALLADAVVAVIDPKVPEEQWDALRDALEPAAVFTNDALSFPRTGRGKSARSSPDFRQAGGRFVYFTSGSTGLPKGVVLAEETLTANVAWNAEVLALGPKDVLSLHLPLSHSYNLVFALCSLVRGLTLLVERDLSDLKGTVARMSAGGATVLQSVPTSLRTLVERADLEATPLTELRAVRVGAGVLTNDLADKTLRAFPRASIVATYGMTELGLLASRTWTSCPIVESTFDRFVPGLAIDLLREDEEEEGEILVTHPLLFVGHFEPEKRLLKLRENPHRTGDMGLFPSPGVLALRSRKKAVAKVAGVLVNLDEVSRIAAAEDGVADACAIAVPHAVFGETVHVFLASAPNLRVDAGEVAKRIVLHTLLRTSPRVHILARLPRSDSGKIARRELLAIIEREG